MSVETPSWVHSQRTHIWLFNVNRGLCIFIRTPLNQGILYDCGSSDDCKPSDFIEKNILPHLNQYQNCRVAQAIISHPHSDHISNIECFTKPSKEKSPFYSSLITCPHDKTEGSKKPEAIDWNRIRNPKGSEGIIETYKSLFEKRTLPLQTIKYVSEQSIPNVEYGLYYVRPPVVDEIFPNNNENDNQEYGNGVSLVLYFRHGKHSVLLPGDLNPPVFKHLLEEKKGAEKRFTRFNSQEMQEHPDWHSVSGSQPSLKALLKDHGLSILVAPHHGLESGYSEDLYAAMKDGKPGLVVISERRKSGDNNGTTHKNYQSEIGAKGQKVKIEGDDSKDLRYSVSTKDGHHMLIMFSGTGGLPEVYLEKDLEVLLSRAK